MARTANRTVPFQTFTVNTTPTSGATTGLSPASSAEQFELAFNATQIIVNNTDATETLYFLAWNPGKYSTLPLTSAIQIAPGGYLTLSLGVRSDRVGEDFITGFNTSASATQYTVTEIYSIST